MTESQDERRSLPSASNWSRYERCHGSYQLSLEARRLGQEAHAAPSDASARGELIHAYLAGIPDEDGNEIQLSESEQTSADFLQERAQGEVARIFGDQPVQQLNEQRLWLMLNGRHAASGRFDKIFYTDSTALVIDWKTGFSEPDPAEQNSQLKVLAVLIGLSLPKVETIYAQIISGPYGVSERRFSIEDLAQAYREIVATLRAIQAPNAPLSPSVEACRYCSAKLICPALQEKRVGIARMELVTLPDGPQASMILDDVAIIRSRCDEIVAYYQAKMLSDSSYKIPGYEISQGAPRRSVADWISARTKLEEFIDVKALNALATFSIPAVEKLLGEAIGVKGPKLKEQLAFILGDLLELKYPDPSLKPVSGKSARLAEIAAP